MTYLHCQINPELKKLAKEYVKEHKKPDQSFSLRRFTEQAFLAFLKPAPSPELVAAGVAYQNSESFKGSLLSVISGNVTLQSLADSMASPWAEYPPDENSPGTAYFPKVPGTTPRFPPEMYGHPFGRKTWER